MEVDDAVPPGRDRDSLALAAEKIMDRFDDHDGEPERDEDLILVRPIVVKADQSAFEQEAEDEKNQGPEYESCRE